MNRFPDKFKNVDFRPTYTKFDQEKFPQKMVSATFMCLLNPRIIPKIRQNLCNEPILRKRCFRRMDRAEFTDPLAKRIIKYDVQGFREM